MSGSFCFGTQRTKTLLNIGYTFEAKFINISFIDEETEISRESKKIT